MKDIAFCIPAYNRYDCLIELFNSIIKQVNDLNRNRIQICVSDDCSPNSLEPTIEYMKQYNIEYIYHRNEENLGADRNFLKSAEIATAKYCWMMGDDDGITDGALDLILHYIKKYPDINVFFGNRYVCNRKLKPFMKESWTRNKKDFIVDFTNDRQIKKYFDKLNSTTCLGYLTTLIVKKEAWDAVKDYEPYIGTIYIQVAKYLLMLYKKDKMFCISSCIALSRFGNDNFYSNLKQRIFMDYYGFLRLAEIFNDNKQLKNSFLGIVRRHYNNIFLNAMSYTTTLNKKDLNVLRKVGYTNKQISIFIYRNRFRAGCCFLGNIIKSIFVDFKWFYKTCFVTIQKIL